MRGATRTSRLRAGSYNNSYDEQSEIESRMAYMPALIKFDLEELKATLMRRRTINARGCWLFPTSNETKYGEIRRENKVYKAHTLSLMIWVGPKPKGPNVQGCHTCDNRPCFNPNHLYWGTQKSNSMDMIARNRGGGQFTSQRTRGIKHYGARLTNKDVIKIRKRIAEGKFGIITQIAKEYNLTISQISRIKHNRVWKWLKCA